MTTSTVTRHKTRRLPKSILKKPLPVEQDIIHLDLNNFEYGISDESPFILTSPRSLEACDRLEIQPVELLHKPLQDFEEELLLAGQSTIHAKKLYDMYEKLRCTKLKKCRREREVLVTEQYGWTDRRSKDHNYNGPTRELEELSLDSISEPRRKGSSLRSTSLGSLGRLSATSRESLNARDKKIVDLMELRRMKEKREEAEKVVKKMAWEEERSKEQQMKIEAEMERRSRLTERRHLSQRKQEEKKKLREMSHKKIKQEAKEDLETKEIHHEWLAEKQKEIKSNQIQIHQTWEHYKKEKQEKNLKELERSRSLLREHVGDHMTLSMLRAEELRKRNETTKQLEIQAQNAVEEKKQRAIKDIVEEQRKEKVKLLKSSIHNKDVRTSHVLQNAKMRQSRRMLQTRHERDTRQRSASLSRMQHLEDLEEWKQEIRRNKQRAHERASSHVSSALVAKVEKVIEERIDREKAHQELQKRVKENEAVKKAHTKIKIQQKDRKSREVVKQKQSAIHESRAYAFASAREREEIRQKYSKSFDKIAARSDIESRIGFGPQTSVKNYSSILFG